KNGVGDSFALRDWKFVISIYKEQRFRFVLLLLNLSRKINEFFQVVNGGWSSERYQYREDFFLAYGCKKNMMQEGRFPPSRPRIDDRVFAPSQKFSHPYNTLIDRVSLEN